MKRNIRAAMFCLIAVGILFVSNGAVALTKTSLIKKKNPLKKTVEMADLDPLVDLTVTVEIDEIRALDKIDKNSDPDFYVKIYIDDHEYVSPVWHNMKYVKQKWSVTHNVPDDVENVTIKIQLWDWNPGLDKLCDISRDYDMGNHENDRDIDLIYSLKTGHWVGEDYVEHDPTMFDPSGYGRLNGCDDNSIYQNDLDCELWFNIYQDDYDGDGIPYWTEVNVFGTDPTVDDTGMDADNDGVPIEWEYKWGYTLEPWRWEHGWVYNPFTWENHSSLDPDRDGLSNVEEYLTSQWGSDPFRKDLFIELDQMEESPRGEKSILPDGAKDLLRDAYDKHNIVYHLDDGCMGGSDMIPFDEVTTRKELQDIYWNYFLHGDPNNWRRGVFHYGIVVYNATYPGFVFWGGVGPYLDSFQISSKGMEKKVRQTKLLKPFTSTEERRNIVYASAYMHETGHTLGIFNSNTPGCDDQYSKYPWQKDWWKWRPYKSVMNYGYMYLMVDYSDGSRGKNDFNDWANLDLAFFQRKAW